jgi:hypothetical protein
MKLTLSISQILDIREIVVWCNTSTGSRNLTDGRILHVAFTIFHSVTQHKFASTFKINLPHT